MAKKYINAEMLIAELDASCMPIFEKGISGILGDNESIADVIRSQPAADVQEVKHGYWEHIGSFANGGVSEYWLACSNCKVLQVTVDQKYVYCPHCGARMDGDKE